MADNLKTVGVSVTSRALAILGAFDAVHSGLSLSELSRRTGLPLATAHRLIRELQSWGALSRGLDGRYRIGLRIWELGALTPSRTGLREAALPSLLSLLEASREEVRLVVADGGDAVCVEHLGARDDRRGTDLRGLRRPLHESACGLALLAHRGAGGTAVQRCLPLYRKYGCVVRPGEPRAGRKTVAMPVVGDDLTAVAAVGLTLPDEAALGHGRELLIAATAGIQRALSRRRAVAA
ncbi:helix-turn-helix domain-containing protein [Streptomyces sp. TM32]|uniref:IclR family transcriptional regulator n=1 Tax=Streptomyces sp. TM32 TaxID=1652669 RepID=UPI0013869BD9|nr:helix-turn-helix domain-containing protein [Streptomyces sp. TM32]